MEIQSFIKTASLIINLFRDKARKLIKKSIENEVSNLSYKILVGIVISAIIIFATIQFGIAYQEFLSQYKNQLNMQLTSFGLIIFLGLIFLYFLFRSPSGKKQKILQEDQSIVDLPEIMYSFASGIMEGYQIKVKKNEIKDL